MTDPLGDGREVVLFDSAGVGRSTGNVPTTIAGMAAHALQFLDGLCVTSCDVLGFSLGGMVAQQMALDRPSSIHRMILVGTAPRGGEDIMHLEKPQLAAFREWEQPIGARFADLKSIQQPTLAVNGIHDDMIPVSNSYRLIENLPNAVLPTCVQPLSSTACSCCRRPRASATTTPSACCSPMARPR